MPLDVPEEGLEPELQDTLAFLEAERDVRERERRWAQLSCKRPSEWSEEERREARRLFPQGAPQGADDG